MSLAFNRWYNRNKEEFNAKRRQRYKSDPEYRKKVIHGVRAMRNRIAAEREVNSSVRVSEAANKIGRTAATIRDWEKRGFIPKSKDAFGHRRYTEEQIKLMKLLADVLEKFRYRRVQLAELQRVVKHVRSNW